MSFMQRVFLSAFVLVLAVLQVRAVVQPEPRATPTPRQIDARGNPWEDLTSDVASLAHHATSFVGSVVSDATAWKDITTTVTNVGTGIATVVTKKDGPAITLAPSGSPGERTTFYGSEFTVQTFAAAATPTSTSTHNAAASSRSFASMPLLAVMLTAVTGALLGALVAI
ncbi:hypothetical protein BOTBODRAFT_49950 [Botryobasidium botryosum FD-172 SS1]|uniref:Uncharacterized protein n=1 Tax=Botryobasidium botryosum (strain FD-172 SS1) TaxID=930990 RepID=A0A067N2V9_BOTB1|nr:hypothetical protein BOTBODRAFT_49950 [Botryobasidium botryosum FD-172 SS1]